MICAVCSLELQVKRLQEDTGALVLACRNQQCPEYGREQELTAADIEAGERRPAMKGD